MSLKNRSAQRWVLLLLIAGVFTSLVASAKQNIVFCFEDKAYPPHIYLNEQNEPAGILVDKIKWAAKQVSSQAVFVTSPWLRCQKMVTRNQAQALFAMIKTEQRAETFQFPKNQNHYLQLAEYPVFYNLNGPFANHLEALFEGGNFRPQVYREIRQFGLQAPMGYVAQGYLKSQDLMAPFDYTVEQGLIQVSNNRLDGYIVERQIGKKKIAKLQLQHSVKVTQGVVLEQAWYVPFNKRFYAANCELVDQFWLAVSRYQSTTEKE